jgi:signal transduction histidine kinase
MFEVLAHYLMANTSAILERWREAVRRDPAQPARRVNLVGRELDDHLPSLLTIIAECLRGHPPETVEKEGSEHGHQRRGHGYTVTELLGEMTLFRRIVMDAVEREFSHTGHGLSSEGLADARLSILDLLDRSVQASVERYMEEAELERDAARTQVANSTARLQVAYAELAEAHKQKDRFLSMLSHELRNPLGPILTAVQVLKLLPNRDATISKHYALIERQVRHLARLVDDLLDLNRIAHGKLELRRQLVVLQDAIRFAVESSHTAFEEKGVQLQLDLAVEPLGTFADPTRVSQIVINLLTNAVKFTPRGGAVTVVLSSEDNEAVMSVRDNGAGIAPEMLGRVFEPFEQADTALARSSGGLGLGLMIARGLVEAHGGSIEVRSAGIDQGAEFIVRLPLFDGQTPDVGGQGRADAEGMPDR